LLFAFGNTKIRDSSREVLRFTGYVGRWKIEEGKFRNKRKIQNTLATRWRNAGSGPWQRMYKLCWNTLHSTGSLCIYTTGRKFSAPWVVMQ
jgi:hypothetical protein